MTSTGQDGGFDDNQKKSAEVNEDGVIDGRDATLLLTYYTYVSTGHSISLEDYASQNKSSAK